MVPQMRVKLLRKLLLFSGVYEIAFGMILIFFIEPLFTLFGILPAHPITYPVFSHVSGMLAVSFGLILCFAAKEPEQNLFIAYISIALRVALQVIIIYNALSLTFMMVPLLSFGMIDLALAILTYLAIWLK